MESIYDIILILRNVKYVLRFYKELSTKFNYDNDNPDNDDDYDEKKKIIINKVKEEIKQIFDVNNTDHNFNIHK